MTMNDPLFASVPGPSPWYMRGATYKSLQWLDAPGSQCTGIMVLADRKDVAYLALDFRCYFMPSADLLWYQREHGMHIRLLRALEPLGSVRQACRRLRKSGETALLRDAREVSVRIPVNLTPGVHRVAFPEELQNIDELLLLVRAEELTDEIDLRLWVVHPDEHSVTVHPQDWYNNGPYDFGYQWVARVARDPATGRIHGEGVRLPPFVVDATLRRIQ